MAKVGYQHFLYVNTGTIPAPTWTEVDLARDVTLNREKTEIDATSRATARGGWTATEDGLKSFTAEFESLYDPGNPAFDALEAAFDANTDVDVLVLDGAVSVDGSAGVRVTCGVFGGNRSEPLNDVVTVNYSLKNKDVPASGTVTGGVFS